MRVLVITEPGDPDVLRIEERPRPEPGKGEIRVRVAAAGLNRADLLQRRGRYPAPAGWPADVPGLEYAGTVDALGAGVTRWSVGDRVMGLVGGGACAEYVTVHELEAVAVPEALSDTNAAGVPEVFVTAHDALFTRLGLRSGERLLIHAVGSGVGTAALQLALAVGATPIGTSRTPEKLERAKELGLRLAVVARDGRFADAILEATGGRRVHAILDLVGGAYLGDNLRCLETLGRQVVVGTVGGARAELDLGTLLRSRLTLSGTALRSRPLDEKIAALRAFEREVVPLLADGRVRPVVEQVYAMEDAAAAHRLMESDRSYGKIVLSWS
mgnify:CR=1 FL=1